MIIVVIVQNWRPHAQIVQIHEEVLRYRFFFRASPDGIEAWLEQFLDEPGKLRIIIFVDRATSDCDVPEVAVAFT